MGSGQLDVEQAVTDSSRSGDSIRAVPGSSSHTGRRARVTTRALVAVLMVLPAVVAVASLAGRPWYPVDDFGVTDALVRSVWSVHVPLIGLYSRPPWNHPGPMMFWLIGLVSGPAGGAPWATRVGGALIQGVAIGWLAWLAWRRGLRTMLAVGAVTVISLHALGPILLREPWTPNVAVSVFVLFLFVTAFVANGSFRLLIAMAGIGSFLVETHVSYTLLVVAAFAWVLVCTLVDARRRGHGPPRWRSTVVLAAGVTALCWIGPLVEAVTHRGGNLRKIAAYFLESEHTRVGFGPALRIMAAEFHAVPPWLGGHEPYRPFSGNVSGFPAWWLLVGIAFVAIALLATKASGSSEDRRDVLLAVLMLVVGTIGISSADEPRAYAFAWRPVVAVFLVVTCVWAVARAVAAHVPGTARGLGAALAFGCVAWASIALTVSIPSAGVGALSQREPTLRLIDHQLGARELPRGTVLLRSAGANLPSLFDGLVDDLSRRGVDVRVDAYRGRMFGVQYVVAPKRAGTMWYVTESGGYTTALLRIPGSHVVASTTPLTAAQESELERLDAQVWDELLRAGRPDLVRVLDNPFVGFATDRVAGLDRAAVSRLGDLNTIVTRSGACRCAVVAVPPRADYPLGGLPIYR